MTSATSQICTAQKNHVELMVLMLQDYERQQSGHAARDNLDKKKVFLP